MNTYSLEDEIIKLLDSSDEEEYNNRFINRVHDDPIQSEVDMSSPISDVELSEGELNDEEMENVDEVEDEDEISNHSSF